MLRVAIGPQVPLPSWNWIGFELARELAKYFDVRVFPWEAVPNPPACDVLLAVKLVHSRLLDAARVLYLPVDNYVSPAALEGEAPLLSRCAAIGCHAEPLVPLMSRYCRQVFFLDHHAKFALPELAPYKERGFVLWVGAFEHVPYLLAWCRQNPLPLPLVIQSNFNDLRSRNQAAILARQLGITLKLTQTQLNGHRLVPWFEVPQRQLMQEAKAAIDIKGGPWLGQLSGSASMDYWQQQLKPPTKAQQFVCSGIPLAVNRDSHTFKYYRKRGLELTQPQEVQRWLSREYWEQTQAFARECRPQLTLERIGVCVRDQILAIGG